MRQCEFCRSDLPDDARFCGNCGNIPDSPINGHTRISSVQPSFERESGATQDTTPTAPLIDEEEEKRRRAALPGLGLVGVEVLARGGQAPMVQGTPQVGNVPFVQGAPQSPGSAIPGNFHSAPTQASPQAPISSQPPTSISSPTITLHHLPQGQQGPQGPGGTHTPHGCAPQLIIAAIVLPLLILGSIIGLGLTIFAPGLSLSGGSSVSAGGTLTLHGSHFVPGSSVSLLLDGSTPLFVALPPASNSLARISGMNLSAALPVGQSAIKAGGDGSFTVTININPTWAHGKHTIVASEAVTHRSASLDFTILSPGETPTPTATGTLQPSPTGIVSPTVTVTPTKTLSPTAPTAQPGLSCLSPSSITPGPVTENSPQAVTSSVKLCSNGTGIVNWTANWDTVKSPWLSLNPASGQLTAPAQTQITISASAAQLAAGNYSAVVTFSSASNPVTETLNVSFAVQAGCISASPTSLSFVGMAGVSDPASQTVNISTCSSGGAWQASAKTTDGANWLYVSPTSGVLSAGAAPSGVTVSVSNLKAQLKAGTYTGSVTFTLGSGSIVVNVSLTVQPAPILASNTTSLVGSANCSTSTGNYVCYVTLTNTSKTTNLSWTSSVINMSSPVITPASNTLAPGQSERVRIDISANDCSANASITFTGPANSVTVTWMCYYPIG